MKELSLNVNKMHFPVSTLGPGKRIGIWLQGCSIHCEGCISHDTWEFSDSSRVGIAEVLEVLEVWLPEAEGLTISGGEPFDQLEGLEELLLWFDLYKGEREVLVYSGYEFSFLHQHHGALLEKIDALASGPFDVSAGQSKAWLGSDNQELHLLSEQAKNRYADVNNNDRSLDVFEDEKALWFAGVPRAEEWSMLEGLLAAKGLSGKFSHFEH